MRDVVIPRETFRSDAKQATERLLLQEFEDPEKMLIVVKEITELPFIKTTHHSPLNLYRRMMEWGIGAEHNPVRPNLLIGLFDFCVHVHLFFSFSYVPPHTVSGIRS